MRKSIAPFLIWLSLAAAGHAQTSITLPIAANAVADLGNGPLKARVTQGNASIFTAQGSGVGSTSGSSTALTLTTTPATAPLVGGYISGTGITSGTTITAYNGTTGITLSAAMTVAGGTSVAWGAACPASAAGIPAHYIAASVMSDYYLLYTQARICAVSPGGPSNTLLVLPVFYDSTTPGGGGGGGAVSSVFGRTGAVVANSGDYDISLISGLGFGVTAALGVNIGTAGALSVTVAKGAKALATSAISSTACTSAQTDTAIGTLTTDVVAASFNGDPTAVTGYVPLTAGMLTIIAYPTVDTVNFKVCNNTGSSITPGAITLNWRVTR